MPRRPTRNITGIAGTGAVDYKVVWRVLECCKPGCDALLKVSEDEPGFPEVTTKCPKCGSEIGPDFIQRAPQWKYCRVCEWLQPLDAFHRHKPNSSSFRSGRQLECKVCKNLRINPNLNPKRTADQHREAAQKRRLYALLSGEPGKIDSKKVFDRFHGRCFKCGEKLKYTARGRGNFRLDHTLPAKLLWPLTTENATLLCGEDVNDCNNHKHDLWPAKFYTKPKLRELAVLTGFPFDSLAGSPKLNPAAVAKLRANVDQFLQRWIEYQDEISRIRKLVLEMEGFDIKQHAHSWPAFLDEE